MCLNCTTLAGQFRHIDVEFNAVPLMEVPRTTKGTDIRQDTPLCHSNLQGCDRVSCKQPSLNCIKLHMLHCHVLMLNSSTCPNMPVDIFHHTVDRAAARAVVDQFVRSNSVVAVGSGELVRDVWLISSL